MQQFNSLIIGNQIWMAENLNIDFYRNGDTIPEISDPQSWGKFNSGAWCCYENKSHNLQTYGKLYNWLAVMDERGLAPEGWHIPSDTEWDQLIESIGGVHESFSKVKSNLSWDGTNESGFNGLPAGFRIENGIFKGISIASGWWSSTKCEGGYPFDGNKFTWAWSRILEPLLEASYLQRIGTITGRGLSVRCIKD